MKIIFDTDPGIDDATAGKVRQPYLKTVTR